jgi:hypothetical protein
LNFIGGEGGTQGDRVTLKTPKFLKYKVVVRGFAPSNTNFPLSLIGFVLEGFSPKEEGD